MLASDDPGWWQRSQHRAAYRAADLPPIVVAERGYPCSPAMLKQKTGHGVWDECGSLAAEYLRAVGLSRRPDWVYGIGPRAVWPDDPGRWFVAHAATPEIVAAGRAHVPGTIPKPASYEIGFMSHGEHPINLVRRSKGEPAPTIADSMLAVIRYCDLDPAACFGASPYATPQKSSDASSGNVFYSVGAVGVTVIGLWEQLAPRHEEFRRACPHDVPFTDPVPAAGGNAAVVRLAYGDVFGARCERGDPWVPWSPVELAVAFVEIVGVAANDCWGITEVQLGGGEARSAHAQLIYRPRAGDADGRARFARYVGDLGGDPAALEFGHPEGTVVASGRRFKMVRGSG